MCLPDLYPSWRVESIINSSIIAYIILLILTIHFIRLRNNSSLNFLILGSLHRKLPENCQRILI